MENSRENKNLIYFLKEILVNFSKTRKNANFGESKLWYPSIIKNNTILIAQFVCIYAMVAQH